MHDFLTAVHTDVGRVKRVNQDAVFLEIAMTDVGPVLLAAICDGMGGLADGEKASAQMAYALGEWFETSLASTIVKESSLVTYDRFQAEFDFMIRKTAEQIEASSQHASGTTIAALLMASGVYYTANVGDSRVYCMHDHLVQLTKDQTVVQRELDAGKITEKDIPTHPQRSVLLQCVGASEVIIPDYTQGTYGEGDTFLLCSDGFRHLVTVEELEDALFTDDEPSEDAMKNTLVSLTETNKKRGEKDNISSIMIKTTKEKRF